MQKTRHLIREGPAGAAGHKNPPSAPPAIPPILINPLINPFGRDMPHPAIDPRPSLPGPPIVPPPGPGLRII
ncbi:hypothetical protein [uncultured Massilia sp.]|uniref:hypothetical protein n=1 Tax=uncultured Massilia sp. TaxID=169973 RepID=UPI0025DE2D72|nr:hypothetical protein [uncultured Massilia sp.]